MNGLFALVALVGVLAAIAFFLSARTAKAALAAREGAAAKLAADVETTRKAAADARAEAKKKAEEASGLRADLERTKKKAFEQQEASKRLGGAQALREEIDKLAARLAEARAEAEHQATRARGFEKDLEKATTSVKRLEAARVAHVEAPKPVAAAPAPVAAAPVPAPDDGKLQAERERAEKAEAKATELRKRIAELEQALKNARGRLETERRVYIVQKGELELAADRYTELHRRHDALRRDHEELVEAVRQAAREERRLTEKEAARAEKQTPPAAPEGEGQAAGTGAADGTSVG